MIRHKVMTILGIVLAFACVAKTGLAQTQATNAHTAIRGSGVCRRTGARGDESVLQ